MAAKTAVGAAGDDDGPDELWTLEQVAAYLQVPLATVRRWRSFGEGPPGFRVGKHVRVRKSVVIRWVREREQESLR